MEVKVFTWNVLSESFFNAESYPTYDPNFFDSERKTKQVLDTITKIMAHNYLIVLYEVCDNLRSELIKKAIYVKYVVRDAYYGHPDSGNMGIVMMWPCDYYLHSYDQFIVGQYIEATPEEEKPKPRSCWQWFWNKPKEWTSLDRARNKKNVMILATLSYKGNETKKFILAGYHMPCTFNEPKIMEFHIETIWMLCKIHENPKIYDNSKILNESWTEEAIDLLTGPIRSYEDTIPLILSMDMNAKPDSDIYKYMISRNMISAHKYEGREPSFTTNVMSKFTPDGFKATIDYVWVTRKLIVEVDSSMPTQFTRLLPNDKFPSDHYWMKFTLQFE